MTENFWTQNLFAKQKSIKISFLEIAKLLCVSERTAKRYIKKDLENGFLKKETTQYKCKKYKTLLVGRNIYHISKRGEAVRNSKHTQLTPQRFLRKKNSFKKEFAKGNSLVKFSKTPMKSNLLKAFDAEHLLKRAPSWWFDDIKVLAKTLKLLKQKKLKAYKIKNEVNWVSSVIKDQGRGYRSKIAKDYALFLTGKGRASKKIYQAISEYSLVAFDNLNFLKSKGLKTGFKDMERFLRKGFSHMALSAKIFSKVLKYHKICNLNGFFNWMISLEDPNHVFCKKRSKPKDLVDWAKNFFTKHSDRFVFDTKNKFDSWYMNPSLLDTEKTFIQFHVFPDSEKSFVRSLKQKEGRWEDIFISAKDEKFKRQLIDLLSA